MTDPTLHLGDCLDVMGDIPAGSIDLILADLPYGTTACKWDVVIPFEPLWAHYRRVLGPRGAVILTASQPFTSMLVMSNREWFRYEWVWDKVTGTNFQHARHQPLKSHENILVFSPSPAVFTKHGGCMPYSPQRTPREAGKLRPSTKSQSSGVGVLHSPVSNPRPSDQYDEAMRLPVTVLRFPGAAGECNSRHRCHPSQKPVALMEYLIRTYSDGGDTVLDNAMGSGTTGVACLNAGRDFIGIELDPAHFATAQRRLAAARESVPLFPAG